MLWGLALAALAALGVAGAALRRPAAPPPMRPVRFLFTGPDSAPIVENFPWPAAISPDGGTLVYSVAERGGSTVLYSRRTDQLEGHPIPGTANGSQPLFSPDGQWLAFEAGNKEKKIRLDGSAPVTIAEGGWNNGADWTTADELVVGSTRKARGLLHVSVAGGELAQFTLPDSAKGELDHLWPIALPDGHSIVFTIWSGALATAKLAMTSLPDGKVTRLGLKGIRPLALLDGALVYLQADGAVMAVPLDVSRHSLAGKPVPVLDPVPVNVANNGNSAVFVSRGGALVTALASHRARLMWIGRDGVSHQISPAVGDYTQARLSPDGRRVAMLVADGSRRDVWIHELETGTLSRLTTHEGITSAVWSSDGSRIVYSAAGSGSTEIWAQSVAAGTAPTKLTEMSDQSPFLDISPDGHSLVLQSLRDNGWQMVRAPVDSGRSAQVFAVSDAGSFAPRFSPDGRWVALVSPETGRFEVYVRSYPDANAKIQVSVGGGDAPVWSADGTRVYYSSGTVIVEARLATTPTMRVVARDTAFTGVHGADGGFGEANYDVAQDGSRIVLPISETSTYSLVIVPNWLTEFRERMGTNRK